MTQTPDKNGEGLDEERVRQIKGMLAYHCDQINRLARHVGALGEKTEDVVTKAISLLPSHARPTVACVTDEQLLKTYDDARYGAACPVSGTGTDGHIEGLRAIVQACDDGYAALPSSIGTPYDQAALDAASRELHMMLLREGSSYGTKACEEMGRVFMTAYRKAAPSATLTPTLQEALRRCAQYHQDDAMLDAPCVFCGYNGAGYWQSGTHAKDCRWYSVGGYVDRHKALGASDGGTNNGRNDG
jgi:hypothetical protein